MSRWSTCARVYIYMSRRLSYCLAQTTTPSHFQQPSFQASYNYWGHQKPERSRQATPLLNRNGRCRAPAVRPSGAGARRRVPSTAEPHPAPRGFARARLRLPSARLPTPQHVGRCVVVGRRGAGGLARAVRVAAAAGGGARGTGPARRGHRGRVGRAQPVPGPADGEAPAELRAAAGEADAARLHHPGAAALRAQPRRRAARGLGDVGRGGDGPREAARAAHHGRAGAGLPRRGDPRDAGLRGQPAQGAEHGAADGGLRLGRRRRVHVRVARRAPPRRAPPLRRRAP
jgi:hypothetical protein